ncbi:hypothetical protein GCM10007276_09210 [Agaricicola taiwanensis]|uniref:Phasin domain-containing protein n=1 Tax=Agaricicola taiwanensis TaxID=591372 RepID=A0A8J2VNM3_9RHOB|nr:phasin [Agaricicola taiwanensis]GGE34007.1 hypothetical protein GCM10007276_09210 [Agaricicola taiwanensis]
MANVKATAKADELATETAAAPKVEVPEAIRTVAEKSVAQAKSNYDALRTSAEDTSDRIEESYLTANKGAAELRVKALEATRDNFNAVFDLAVALTNAKSLSEAVELQTTHVRKQFEAFTAQSKDLAQLAGRIATDTAKPYQDLAAKSMSLGR